MLALILNMIILTFNSAHAENPSPQLVGWGNLFLPGLGATLRGSPERGLGQLGYEGATFAAGYSLADQKGLSSLDGISDTFSAYKTIGTSRNSQQNINPKMFSDIFLEFSIKSHLVNTFIEYRDAYKARGITEGLDQHSATEGLLTPFDKKYLAETDVWIPLAIVAGAFTADYLTTTPNANQPLTPGSNLLYAFNYGIWQPLGSGYPEEVAYRGFLQHEVQNASGSSLLAIFTETTAFAFSHEPGSGRYTAAAVGLYLGYLADKHHGDLGPGSFLHFWGNLIMGLESVLLNAKAQKTTMPGGFTAQFNF